MKIFSLLVLSFLSLYAFSQNNNSTDSIHTQVNDRTLNKLSQSYSDLNHSINKQSNDILEKYQKKEIKLKALLQKKDSLKSEQLFANTDATFQMLRSKMAQPLSTNVISSIKNYIPSLDSTKTALQFLNKSGSSIINTQKATALIEQIAKIQTSFQNANSVQEYLEQREANLQAQLSQLGLGKELTTLDKQVFYYQQVLSQYKDVLNDQQKQQEIILSVVKNVPSFQNFWTKNSMLSQLFPLPGNAGSIIAGTGLQTTTEVGKNIQQRMGTNIDDGGANASQFLQQKASEGQGEIDQIKSKLDNLSMNSGNSEMVLPDFTPINPKKRAFLDRLELGFNIQNNNGTTFLPTTTNLGVSLGYKINKKATVGIGMSYLLGLGTGINHIHLSNQGLGFQNFVNIQVKGTIWITGGMEFNYMEQFTNLSIVKNLDPWQKSALLGIIKKYNVGKKSGNIQLLYDFLALREIPQSQPLKIRFGFGLN